MKVAVQAAVAGVGLVCYLAGCLAYRWKWDAAIRAALGRRLGVPVRWRWVSDTGSRPNWAWHSDAEGPLGRTLWHTTVIRATQYATAALVGILPALGLLGLLFWLDSHPLVVLATAALVIPIASVFFLRSGPGAADAPGEAGAADGH
jgi:hypothetical protein